MSDRQPTPSVRENFKSEVFTDHDPCPCGDNDGQWCSIAGCPYPKKVAAPTPRAPISDEELEQWAKTRADDAGHLARELVEYRRGTTPAPGSNPMGPDFGSHGSATAMFDVIAERLRQQEKEGWTPEHDDAHKEGELAQAAAVYAHPFEIVLAERRQEYERGNNAWPWYNSVDVSGGRGDCPCWGWRPAWLKKTDRRRDLVKAAALIIAEIERLDRAAIATTEGSDNG